MSRDHLPFVGNVGEFSKITEQYRDLAQQQEAEPIALYPQLYALVGLGSRGLSSAPLMAELLASQMCGDPMPLGVDLLEQLHPSRMWFESCVKARRSHKNSDKSNQRRSKSLALRGFRHLGLNGQFFLGRELSHGSFELSNNLRLGHNPLLEIEVIVEARH